MFSIWLVFINRKIQFSIHMCYKNHSGIRNIQSKSGKEIINESANKLICLRISIFFHLVAVWVRVCGCVVVWVGWWVCVCVGGNGSVCGWVCGCVGVWMCSCVGGLVGVGGCAWVWVYRRMSCAYDYVYDHECVCFIKLMNDQSMVI